MNTNAQMIERNSAIELLRIIAGMAVITLHFNFFPSGGGAVQYADGITKMILVFIETLSICAVNVFVIISGYCNANSRKLNISRLLKLVIQTSLFSFAFIVDAPSNSSHILF